jgi:hypothetical protein
VFDTEASEILYRDGLRQVQPPERQPVAGLLRLVKVAGTMPIMARCPNAGTCLRVD